MLTWPSFHSLVLPTDPLLPEPAASPCMALNSNSYSAPQTPSQHLLLENPIWVGCSLEQ